MGAVAVCGSSCGVEDSRAEVWGRDSWIHRNWGFSLVPGIEKLRGFFIEILILNVTTCCCVNDFLLIDRS